MKKTMIVAAALAMVLSGCANGYYGDGAVPASARSSLTSGESAFTEGYEALKLGDYVTAERALATSMSIQPQDAYTNLAMGYLLQNTGRGAQAAPYYATAIANGEEVYPPRTYNSGSTDEVFAPAKGLSIADYARRNQSALYR